MKLVPIDPSEYNRQEVPVILVKAVKILNEAIAIDAKAVTEALGSGDHLIGPEARKKFLEHPQLLLGEAPSKLPALSGLGILNGILMTHRFRLYITTEDDNYTYKSAGIYEDTDWKAEEEA
jgi:hypothetical protein